MSMTSSSVGLCLGTSEAQGLFAVKIDTRNPWSAPSYRHAKPEGEKRAE